MARKRSRREVVERCRALAKLVAPALTRAADGGSADPGALEALWQAEGLGVLLWAFSRVELPPYDRPFDHGSLLRIEVSGDDRLRQAGELDSACETARLWLWRARTAELLERGSVELPPPWSSFEQLIAATAMRGHERGLLPRPLRGDFPAFGTVYRALGEEQQAEALSIAWERRRALAWLTGLARSWDDVPVDS